MLLALRVKSVSGEGGGMIRGVLSSHGRDNQPSVYGWNRLDDTFVGQTLVLLVCESLDLRAGRARIKS